MATVEGLFETADGAKISYSASIPAGEARGTVLCFNGAFFNKARDGWIPIIPCSKSLLMKNAP